jgi:hypothetical protein
MQAKALQAQTPVAAPERKPDGAKLVRMPSGTEFVAGGECLRSAIANGGQIVGDGLAVAGEGGTVNYGFGEVPKLPQGDPRTSEQIANDHLDAPISAGWGKTGTVRQQLNEAARDFSAHLEAGAASLEQHNPTK